MTLLFKKNKEFEKKKANNTCVYINVWFQILLKWELSPNFTSEDSISGENKKNNANINHTSQPSQVLRDCPGISSRSWCTADQAWSPGASAGKSSGTGLHSVLYTQLVKCVLLSDPVRIIVGCPASRSSPIISLLQSLVSRTNGILATNDGLWRSARSPVCIATLPLTLTPGGETVFACLLLYHGQI